MRSVRLEKVFSKDKFDKYRLFASLSDAEGSMLIDDLGNYFEDDPTIESLPQVNTRSMSPMK